MGEKSNSFKTKAMYGCGDIFGGGAFLLISLLFLNFLTDVELLPPALAGFIIMGGKIFDAVTDPMMGLISDRTRSKFGRRRIYFLLGIIPIFISFSLLWYSFNISGKWQLFSYYFIIYMLFSLSFTIVMIPYNSLLPDMVKDFNMRTSYTTARMCFSVFSAMLAGVLPNIIVNRFESIKTGYLVMGIIFAALYAIPWIFVFFGTWEEDKEVNSTQFNFFKELKSVFKNKLLRTHLSIFLSSQAAVDLLTTLFIYYLTVCLNRQKEFSMVLGALLITQLLCMPLHSKISRKYTKVTPLKFGLIIWALSLISSLFLNAESPKYLIYVISAICGIGTSAATFVPWSILPEVADIDELLTGRRREGIYSGIVTFIRKAANGLVIGLLGVILQIIGYVQPEQAGTAVVQTSGVIIGVRVLFGIAPILFITMALIFSRKYKLNKDKHLIIMNEVDRIKNTNNYDVDDKTREVCEETIGFSYDKIKELRSQFAITRREEDAYKV